MGASIKKKTPYIDRSNEALLRLFMVMNCMLSFLGAFVKLRKATVSFVMSVRPSTGRIFVKFDICGFLKNLLRKFKHK